MHLVIQWSLVETCSKKAQTATVPQAVFVSVVTDRRSSLSLSLSLVQTVFLLVFPSSLFMACVGSSRTKP